MTIALAGLLLGMAGSLHCVLMCGPLVMLATGRPGSPAAGWSSLGRRLVRSAWHHSGRILMYFGLGLVAGGAGHLLVYAGLGEWLSILAGAALMASALLASLGRHVPASSRWATRFAGVLGRLSHLLRRDRPWNRVALGALNGLLPCGLVYGALLAATGLGRAVPAGVFMLAFGIGSVPALTMTAVAMVEADRSRAVLRRLAPVATGIVGLLLIVRGLGLPAFHAAHTHVMR